MVKVKKNIGRTENERRCKKKVIEEFRERNCHLISTKLTLNSREVVLLGK